MDVLKSLVHLEIEPPVEAKEKEKELEEKKKNFDKKNPWGDIAEEWIAGTGRQRYNKDGGGGGEKSAVSYRLSSLIFCE